MEDNSGYIHGLKIDGVYILRGDDGEEVGRLPHVDLKMMSDEKWNEEARRSAVKHYREFNGKDPESIEAAFEWQRDFVEALISGEQAGKG